MINGGFGLVLDGSEVSVLHTLRNICIYMDIKTKNCLMYNTLVYAVLLIRIYN